MDEVVGVILAAGRGRRLGPLGEHYPKSLLPVANVPLVGHHLRLLHRLGARRALVVAGHQAERIEGAVGDGAAYGVEVVVVRQEAPLGSAHALNAVRSHLRSPFVVLLGDYYFTTVAPEAMLQRLARGESAIAVKREPDERLVSAACAVESAPDGRVVAISEKPCRPRTDRKGCGFYAFQPEALDAVARTPRTALRDEYEITVSLELLVRSGAPLYAEEVIAWDCNVTRPEDLLDCNLEWLRGQGADRLVAAGAYVAADAELWRTVVGEGAAVRGAARLNEVVVFPGTEVLDGASLVRKLLTPEGAIDCGLTPRSEHKEIPR